MDPVRLGRQVRALRRRRGWRQLDLAAAAKVSRSTVSRVELGGSQDLTLRTIDAVVRALSAQLDPLVRWNGEALDRLLDADHAALVETVAGFLGTLGWEVAVEVSFSIRGERGSMDILAFHPATRLVMVVEVKSVVPDLQAMLFVFDRKTRLATEVARQRGWVARGTARLLVVADGRTARRRVAQHETVFRTAFPQRSVAVKGWLRRPDPTSPMSGLWFLSGARRAGARPGARHRVSRAARGR
jgi:transcriptional regulator with XRE-family HTH domain